MKFSHAILSEYFSSPLPDPKVLADMLTNRAFEVESIETHRNDTAYEIKVLPDRAHDAFAHEGMAREISRLFGFSLKKKLRASITINNTIVAPAVSIAEGKLCSRYIAQRIEGITIVQSLPHIQERLITLGARPIHNVVDAANYAMYQTGQPLHVFDADKVVGIITIRLAHEGETIETLDGKKIELKSDMLIISDDEGPLAIAGVKGGKRAEVSSSTTAVIIESAHFNPVSVRKTARGIGLLTDAARRFENGLAPELAEKGINAMLEILTASGAKVGARADIYPIPLAPFIVGIRISHINAVLGTTFSDDELKDFLLRISPKVVYIKNPRETIVSSARTHLGATYVSDAGVRTDAPRKFSCSSFTNYLYLHAGTSLPSIAVDQYAYGTPVSLEHAQPGDLVFANTKEGSIRYKTVAWMQGREIPEGVDHVGVYMGDGKVIHATRAKGAVVEEVLSESAQFQNIVGFRTYLAINEPCFVIEIPPERLDLRIWEDFIEEIGRMVGYENIATTLPTMTTRAALEKEWWYSYRVRKMLAELGFSEIMTSSFRAEGDIEIAYPLADDKRFLRTNLIGNMKDALAKNVPNADLFGLDMVKIFELGSVFPKNGESLCLAIGASVFRGKKGSAAFAVKEAISALESLGVAVDATYAEENTIAEIDFRNYYENAPEPTSWEDVLPEHIEHTFTQFSPYPFASRDVALWVPEGTSVEEVLAIIREQGWQLLARPIRLFDTFTKDGKISYAFRMVFQSREKTLADTDIDPIMKQIYDALIARGWTIR